ncbi:carbon-nitrogen hydrolase family protein [Brucepastera parasyntrophica]|uniref:carbon-nitrogen hydrolase family protein n=1 Tax=Brucepastera parasyntrophica TaxID=2880008 RepID=UPI00210E09FC|nr:carbon-nitrogen hydrolase family protein [Brucepastera parasyntrophica]ULQ58622.1 carbon-nitrogen hydrolase family protein [Brucepastera parasyntrophica]
MFKVAMLQMAPTGSRKGNLEKGLLFCKQAKEMGADLALFPEMWNIGYSFPQDDSGFSAWAEKAIGINSDFLAAVKGQAKQLHMAIAITYLEKWPGLPRNTVTVFDRSGNEMLTYAKVHTCDFGSEKYCAPGDDFHVCELNTEAGTIKIGAMICYDREFPESARILMLKGAEIILVPNACPIEEHRISQLKTRAFENMTGIAMANYPKEMPDCNGHSQAYDGIAFDGTDPFGYRDMLLVEAGEEEGIYIAEFDIEEIRRYREYEAFGNAYRKPKKYGMLVSESVEPPFIRKDSRR